MKKWFKTLESIILCIRFPFLYPRNRFTDTHYVDWDLLKKIKTIRGLGEQNFIVCTLKSTDVKNTVTDNSNRIYNNVTKIRYDKNVKIGNSILKVELKDSTIYLTANDKKTVEISIKDTFGDIEATDVYIRTVTKTQGYSGGTSETNKYYGIMVIYDGDAVLKSKFKFIDFLFDKKEVAKSKILNFYHNYILQFFHCIPNSTELDALDKGWRKKFGIQICKDIRKELLRCGLKYLFTYRIEQIKEKFGTLRWYDAFEPRGSKLSRIISKYENLSYHTCINCGKEANWLSKGWISPYCDDCATDKDNYTVLKK